MTNTVLHTWWILPNAMPEIVRSLNSGSVIDRGWLVDWRENSIPMRKLSCVTVLALVRFGVIEQGEPRKFAAPQRSGATPQERAE